MLVYILYFLLFTIIIGPVGEIPLNISAVHIYFTDIAVFGLFLYWIVRFGRLYSNIKTDTILHPFLAFIAVCILSLVFTPISLTDSEKIISFLYIVRLSAYILVYISIKQLVITKQILANTIHTLLIVTLVVLSLLGWIQYFWYPDLRNLSYLGWDPHFKRIFATYFDPNFLGLILVFGFIMALHLKSSAYKKIAIGVLLLVTILFTYSRSTLLALSAGTALFAFLNKKLQWWGVIFTVCLMLLFLLPRPSGEGVKLERFFTIEARMNNWSQAITLIQKYPFFGVGFDTLRFTRDNLDITDIDSHSASGFDNSFLFVAATTGILGLGVYLFFLWILMKNSPNMIKSMLSAAIVHGMFVNSLFFPWIMAVLWIVIGSRTVKEHK